MAFTGGYKKCANCRGPIRVARGDEDRCKNCRAPIPLGPKVRGRGAGAHDDEAGAATKRSSRRK